MTVVPDDDGTTPDTPPSSAPGPGQMMWQMSQVSQAAWTSPIPPAAEIHGYEQTLPGSAERLLLMAEKGHSAAIDREKEYLGASIDTAKTGQSLAALLAFTSLIAAIVFFALGKPVAGGFLLSMPTVMLVRAFLPGQQKSDPPAGP